MIADIPLEAFVPGKTKVGKLVRIKVILRNGGEISVVDEADSLKIIQKLFTLSIKGRFNFLRVYRYSVISISFNAERLF